MSDTLTPAARAAVERLAYTIEEACEATTLGRTTIYELIASGELRSLVVGRRRLIPADALAALIAGSTDAA